MTDEDEAALEDHKRECLARWLLDNREAGRRIWHNWVDPMHPAKKSREWLGDMKRRIERLKRERAV